MRFRPGKSRGSVTPQPTDDDSPVTHVMDLGPDPLDPHGDGTLRKGDPFYDMMMHPDAGVLIAQRRDDGTWEVTQ